MKSYFLLTFASTIGLTLIAIILLSLRFLNRLWWRMKYVRISILSLCGITISFLLLWFVGTYTGSRSLIFFAASVTSSLVLILVGLAVALILSGIVHLGVDIYSFVIRLISGGKKAPSVSRRNFIKNSAAILPGLALTSQVTGIADSYTAIKIPVIKLPVANLPDKLRGLKIAHLSDSHLGIYKHINDLESAVERIKPHNPDLVLYTGDISDDLDILGETNRIVAGLNPPFGVFASVGNHEYYRGINKVIRIFERSPYPLLLEEGVNLKIKGVPVYIGGANDPVHLRNVSPEFLRKTTEKTMGDAPSDSFKIMMSHRPRGLNAAARFGIDLVLAGHTHGGQLGIGHRSLFEPLLPYMYLWGTYRKKNTTLYTSGGMGHWLPYRLGCPTEAPILILEKS